MARNSTYQYGTDDTPISVANQFGITPQQLISANPGGYPMSIGQNINIPNLASPGAPNPYAPAVQAGNIVGNNTTLPPSTIPQRYQQRQQQYLNATQLSGGASANVSMGQLGNVPGYSQLAGNNPYGQTNFTSGNSFTSGGGGVNLQPGMNNNQFVADVGARILANPAEFDSLPQSAQDAIRQSLGGGSGPPTADPANSPGGRFIQVGEVRWERNKNGRLVKVQYTGENGSWRSKRVVQGGKGQAKARLAAEAARQGQSAVDPGNSTMPGFGVVNFNFGAG
jgi:hypothetical protein